MADNSNNFEDDSEGWIEKGSKKEKKGKDKWYNNQSQSEGSSFKNGQIDGNQKNYSKKTEERQPQASSIQNIQPHPSNIQQSIGKGRGRGRGSLYPKQHPIEKKILPETQAPFSETQLTSFQSISPVVQHIAPLIQNQPQNEQLPADLTNSPLPEATAHSLVLDVTPKKQEKLGEFPNKPIERSSIGRETKFETNHFLIEFSKPEFDFDSLITQYDVKITETVFDKKTKMSIDKPVESSSIGFILYKHLIDKYPIYKNQIFSDFKKVLYTKLNFPSEPFNLKIKGDKTNKIFDVEIKKSKKKDDIDVQLSKIQMLQILFTNNQKIKLFFSSNLRVGRSFFNEKYEKKNLGFNLNLWKGFFVSVRPSEMGLNINFDTAYATFTMENTNIVDLACEYFTLRNRQKTYPNDLERLFKNNFKQMQDFFNAIKGQKIINHDNRTKKIQGFGKNANEHIFPHDGKNISVNEYFKRVKNINLNYPNLPCLDLGANNKTPMELCKTILTNRNKLSTKEQADLVRATAVPCDQRKKNIIELFDKSLVSTDPILKSFGIEKVSSSMKIVPARVFPPPEIEYGENKIQPVNNGRWDNMNKKFFETNKINSLNLSFRWIFLNFTDIQDNNIDNLIDALIDMSRLHNMNIGEPQKVQNFNSRQLDELQFNQILSNFFKERYDLIIIVLPKAKPEFYNHIKTLGDTKFGIATQIIKEATLEKNFNKMALNQLASNICLKINCKFGGINFRISPNNTLIGKFLSRFKMELQENKEFMIFGIDVIHPSPIDKTKTESIAAITGSFDNSYCKYGARLLAQRQPKGESLEQIHDLRLPVEELLQLFYQKNDKFPQHLIFFRDGVSEGQFKNVKNHEINEIRKACVKIDSSYKPGVTFIVASKRNHTRFFPIDPKDKVGKCNNVPPGSMVDSVVVTPDMFDFFMVSHAGIQGTSKPCHYFVLHDENNFKMNELSLLAHYLCHVYARSTNAVSYPAPTYYADLCAERGRQYIRDNYIEENIKEVTSVPINVHSNFKDKMFFI